MGVQLSAGQRGGVMASLWVRPMLLDRIRMAQTGDKEVDHIKAKMAEGKCQAESEGILKMGLCSRQ